GRELSRMQGHVEPVRCLAFSPDGQRLVSGSGGVERTARVWDVAQGQEVVTLRLYEDRWHNVYSHEGAVICLAYSPDGRRIVSGSDDQTVRVWDATSGELLACLRGHVGAVSCVTFGGDGRLVISGGADR